MRSRDEDGHRRAPHDLLGHAAHHEPIHPSPAVGPDDDQVDRLSDGRLDDRLARIALPDEEPDRHALPMAAIDDRLSGRLAVRADLVDAPPIPDTGEPLRPRVDDAHEQDVTAEPASEVEREILGACRRRRKIAGEQDRADPAGSCGSRLE